MTKIYTTLKSVIRDVIEIQRKRRLNQHSYRVLSRLDNHYLTDIGLINEDLHELRSGHTPERFKRSQVDQLQHTQVKLVSTTPQADEDKENPVFDPACFDKAA